MNVARGEDNLPRTLKDFMVYYWRYDPWRWVLFFFLDILHFSRYVVAFFLVGRCVDLLSVLPEGATVPQAAWMTALFIFAVLSMGESAHIWTAYTLRKWKPGLRVKIRNDFYSYLLGHSHAYFQNNFAGSLARKITEISESSVRLHDHVRFSIGGSLIAMVSAVIGLMAVSPWYGLILLLFMASVILPVVIRLPRIGQRSRIFSEVRAEVTGVIVDTLTNISSMRSFSHAGHEIANHARVSETERKADKRRILTLVQIEVYRRIALVVLGTAMLSGLLLGWQSGVVSIGEITTVMGLTFSITSATWMLSWGIVMTADELGYIDDAIRMITMPQDVQDRVEAASLRVTQGRVEFKDVDFKYDAQPIFENFSLEIEPRQKIGLLGPSGAGKSTLVSLLLRLYDLQDGAIQIDGQYIAAVTQESLRRQIAVIPQDTALFHRSLADNIRYGCLNATEEEVIAAAQKAHAHEFISVLPEGYETLVGERGIKLSGGQRQRIAIARAILKNAPILILDEATSALDSESEKMIQESLAELMQGKTVIAIAHRLSTIAHLDRLVVMDKGRIVEDGSHAALLMNRGLYARLWGLQSGGFIGADRETEAA